MENQRLLNLLQSDLNKKVADFGMAIWQDQIVIPTNKFTVRWWYDREENEVVRTVYQICPLSFFRTRQERFWVDWNVVRQMLL